MYRDYEQDTKIRGGFAVVMGTLGSVMDRSGQGGSVMSRTRITSKFAAQPMLGLVVIFGAACAPQAQAPKPAIAPYEADFTYKAPPQAAKLNVTLGILAPQFKAGADMNFAHYKGDDTVKKMLKNMGDSFNEVLVAKGFKPSRVSGKAC